MFRSTSVSKYFWTPAPVPDPDPGFARVTALGTFYDFVKFGVAFGSHMVPAPIWSNYFYPLPLPLPPGEGNLSKNAADAPALSPEREEKILAGEENSLERPA